MATTTPTVISPTGHVVYAAFAAGVAYLTYKSGHKYSAYFFAATAAWNLAKAAS